MAKKDPKGMFLYLRLEKDATWTAQFAPNVPGPGFVKLCEEGSYPVEFYYNRYDLQGSAVYERDICSNREELLASLAWSGSCRNSVRALWDFDSDKGMNDAIFKIFNDAYRRKMEQTDQALLFCAQEDVKDFVQALSTEYAAYACLDEVACFSSQELNIDLVGCVKEALDASDPKQINYVAKFVLQHLDHYIGFCESTGDKNALAAMDQLLRDVRTNHGSLLETPVLLHYDFLADVNLAVLFGKPSLSEQIQSAGNRAGASSQSIDRPKQER